MRGGELLRVPSLLTAMPNSKVSGAVLLQIIGYIVVLIAGRLWLTNTDGQYLAVVLSFAILFAVKIYFVLLGKQQGNPLIITERGIIIWPLIAEYWKDIETYRWEEVQRPGPNPQTGICLRLKARNNFPRNFVYDSFRAYLTLFPSEHLSATNTIFQQHGIKKDNSTRS